MSKIILFFQNNQKTFQKTLSYYFVHITVAAIVAYTVTQDVWVALTLSLLEPTAQAFAFFFHEKIWEKILLRNKLMALQNTTNCDCVARI